LGLGDCRKRLRAIVEAYGIEADKITTQGYGPDQPIADNGNFQGRAANRRVEFEVER